MTELRATSLRVRVCDTKLRHVYLMAKDYLRKGEHVLIDPTIRQFFIGRIPLQIMQKQVPKIFVGTRAEVKALFERLAPLGKWSAQAWLDSYLRTRPVTISGLDRMK